MYLTNVWEVLTEGWYLKIIYASVFTYLLGEYNAAMGALVCLMVIDWLTKWWVLSKEAGGFRIACQAKVISSHGMRHGLHKVTWYMVLLIAAHQLEHFSVLGIKVGNTSTEVISAYLALIESKSIMENLRDTGMTGLEPFIALLGKKQEQITEKKD